MALLIKYKASEEVTLGTGSDVTLWGNLAGSGYDAAAYLTNYPSKTTVDVNGTGNTQVVLQSKDEIGTASSLTTEALPDVTAWPGTTIFVVGRQTLGVHLTDANAPFLQCAHFFIGRGSGDTINAWYGFNTPTQLSIPANNDEYYIICLRANGSNQYLSLNNSSEQTSADVSHFTYTSVLELFGLDSCKGILEVQVWDEYLSGSPFTTEYNALYNEYLAAPTPATITFPSLPTKTVGDANFSPGATSNSPATITYASDNLAVATIVSGNIHIVGAGTATITASQGATTGYAAAADVTRTLTVNALTTSTMAQVNGLDVVLSLSTDGTTWKTLVCETENGIDHNTDTTSVQTKCDNGAVITSPGATSWTVTASGAVNPSPASDEVSYPTMQGWWKNKTLLYAKIEDPDGGFTNEGTGYVTKLSLKNPTNGPSTFDFTLTGTGTLTIA